MKKIVKLRENELKRMITESVRRVLNEGVEYNGKDADDEIWYYTNKIGDVYEEIRILASDMRRGGSNDEELAKDIAVLKRYIKMMWTHIEELEKNVPPTPTMGQVLNKPTPMVHY